MVMVPLFGSSPVQGLKQADKNREHPKKNKTILLLLFMICPPGGLQDSPLELLSAIYMEYNDTVLGFWNFFYCLWSVS